MKEFNNPTMEVVHLSSEDLVCTSTCYGYICNDCVECPEGYDCGIFDCSHSYSGSNTNN